MAHVDSEAVTDIAYRSSDGQLLVRFTSGEWYAYEQVPKALYQRFLDSESKGRFFQHEVRDRFVYRRLS